MFSDKITDIYLEGDCHLLSYYLNKSLKRIGNIYVKK